MIGEFHWLSLITWFHVLATVNCDLLVFTGSQDQVSAQATCASNNATLVTINDPAKQTEVTTVLTESMFWIGLKNLAPGSAEDWRWPDGSPVSYTSWGNGEPNNPVTEKCVIMFHPLKQWFSTDCTSAYPFVCETPSSEMSTSPTLTTAGSIVGTSTSFLESTAGPTTVGMTSDLSNSPNSADTTTTGQGTEDTSTVGQSSVDTTIKDLSTEDTTTMDGSTVYTTTMDQSTVDTTTTDKRTVDTTTIDQSTLDTTRLDQSTVDTTTYDTSTRTDASTVQTATASVSTVSDTLSHTASINAAMGSTSESILPVSSALTVTVSPALSTTGGGPGHGATTTRNTPPIEIPKTVRIPVDTETPPGEEELNLPADITVSDLRVSAICLGSFGIIIMVVVFAVVLVMDLNRFREHIKLLKRNLAHLCDKSGRYY